MVGNENEIKTGDCPYLLFIHLFILFIQRQAYVGARYHDDYKITPQELKYLARCVELLRDQTETSCETKMDTFA